MEPKLFIIRRRDFDTTFFDGISVCLYNGQLFLPKNQREINQIQGFLVDCFFDRKRYLKDKKQNAHATFLRKIGLDTLPTFEKVKKGITAYTEDNCQIITDALGDPSEYCELVIFTDLAIKRYIINLLTELS